MMNPVISECSEDCFNKRKHFTFKHVEPSDIPLVTEYLRNNFYGHEPTDQLHPADDNYIEFSLARIVLMLELFGSHSILALDIETGEIAGTQLCFIWTKEQAKVTMSFKHEEGNVGLPPHRIFLNELFAPLEPSKQKMFTDYQVDEVVWNFIVSVGAKYRQQGLSTELFRRMVHMCKAKGYKVVFGQYSSPFSRRCAEKANFMEIDRVQYNIARGKNGQLLLPHAKEEDFVSLMALNLDQLQ